MQSPWRHRQLGVLLIAADVSAELTELGYCALCTVLGAVGVVILAQVSLFGVVFLLLALHVFYCNIAGPAR